MRPNAVKAKLAAGGTALGAFMFEFATTGVARLAAEAGADFAVFDMEHSGWSIETIRMLLATCGGTSLVPLVRVPTTEYDLIARALDMGAAGIMVPMVESAEQARRIVEFAKYPPIGRRGAAFGIAHDNYTGGDTLAKIAAANRETLLIAQVETAAGVRHVEEIAAVDGIDVLWIGHFDLSNSLGIPVQFTHPMFQDAVAKVLAACATHRKTAGFMCADVADGKALLAKGFRMLAYSGDLWLYQQALRAGLAELRR
ncbi:MAG TPA: aldolase/citrate lyase family protein [Pirellulaceae bacterium]|nr:aldolase/citrate lyase family protein [Pirellulaceae bacterium]